MIRQGDVLLVPCAAPEAKAVGSAFHPLDTKVVLRGETTGHAHQVKGAVLWGYDDTAPQFVQSPKEGASLRHEEHKALALSEGWYRIVRQKEWSPEGDRDVWD